ncbi:MAG: hypothetical protein WCP40_00510 [Opitutae bacterium]
MNFKKDLLALLAALGVLILSAIAYVALDQGIFGVKPLVPSEEERIPELKQKALTPAGVEYPTTPKLSLNSEIKDWFTPEENDDGWDYDLFTTIDIAWDPSQAEYVPANKKAIPLPPFGVSLLSVGHPTYPYVLRSTLAAKSGKEEDREFSIENTITKEWFEKCRLKRPLNDKTPVYPLEYKVVKQADGFQQKTLVLDDRLLGRKVTINDEKPLDFEDTVDVVIAVAEDPSKSWTLHKKGDDFKYEKAHYIIKDIDLVNKTVTVEKKYTLPNPKKSDPKKGQRSDQQVLSLPAPIDPKSAAPTSKEKDKTKLTK